MVTVRDEIVNFPITLGVQPKSFSYRPSHIDKHRECLRLDIARYKALGEFQLKFIEAMMDLDFS